MNGGADSIAGLAICNQQLTGIKQLLSFDINFSIIKIYR
jgi:hypothetical protein